MNRFLLASMFSLCCLTAQSAELIFNFSQYSATEFPDGFVSTSSMSDTPGEWEIVLDEVPLAFEPFSPLARSQAKRPVLAQTGRNKENEHFPMLMYDKETFGNFTLETQFKIVEGQVDQMAGIAFRIQDVNNYYVIRASVKDNTLRFYKVANGQRARPIGPTLRIPRGKWLDLKIKCLGNRIDCWFNGEEAMPTISDSSFATGKIAFYTKSDSVSYFTKLSIDYEASEPLADSVVKATMVKYSRLLGLEIYAKTEENPELHVVASHDPKDLGKEGNDFVKTVFEKGTQAYGEGIGSSVCTVPLRDRNGAPMGVARIYLDSFPGQTRNNALARTVPIVQFMQSKIGTASSLLVK